MFERGPISHSMILKGRKPNEIRQRKWERETMHEESRLGLEFLRTHKEIPQVLQSRQNFESSHG